jgi:hypothetical protein
MKTLYKLLFGLIAMISLVGLSIGADIISDGEEPPLTPEEQALIDEGLLYEQQLKEEKPIEEIIPIEIEVKAVPIEEKLSLDYQDTLTKTDDYRVECDESSCTYFTKFKDQEISYSLSVKEVNSLSKEALSDRLLNYYNSYIDSQQPTIVEVVDEVKKEEPLKVLRDSKIKSKDKLMEAVVQ